MRHTINFSNSLCRVLRLKRIKFKNRASVLFYCYFITSKTPLLQIFSSFSPHIYITLGSPVEVVFFSSFLGNFHNIYKGLGVRVFVGEKRFSEGKIINCMNRLFRSSYSMGLKAFQHTMKSLRLEPKKGASTRNLLVELFSNIGFSQSYKLLMSFYCTRENSKSIPLAGLAEIYV